MPTILNQQGVLPLLILSQNGVVESVNNKGFTFLSILSTVLYSLVVIALIISMGIFIWYVLQKLGDLENKYTKLLEKNHQIKTRNIVQNPDSSKSQTSNDVDLVIRSQLKDQEIINDNIEKVIAKLHHQVTELQQEFINYKQNLRCSTDIEEKKTLFFFSPSSDGKFDFDRSKEFNEENKQKISYRITVNSDGLTGKLEYISGIKDKNNIDHRETTLLPVCEITNPEFNHISRIEMIEAGKVIRENNSWLISTKIKIALR